MTRRRYLGGLAMLAAAAAIQPSAIAAAAPESGAAPPAGPQELAAGDPAFYTPPDPIPAGEHGDLLRFQAVVDPFRYRLMYLSETVSGEPTVVTALVAMSDELPQFGGFRLLLHGHDAVGVAAACAPSTVIDQEAIDRDNAQEFESMTSAINDGWIIVSTDYERRRAAVALPYLVGVSEARSLLDAGRAARQLPVAYVGDTTALLGTGQGGHAALWAAQLAPEWTPEQAITGTVAIAATSEVGALAARSTTAAQDEWTAPAILAGIAAAYPDVAAALPLILTPSGTALVQSWSEQCFDAEAAAAPPFVVGDPTTVEPFTSLLRANDAGAVAAPARPSSDGS